MPENKELSTEKVENIKEILKDLDVNFLDHSVIADNKMFFDHEEKPYRVVMPSPKDLFEAENAKHKIYGKLLKTEGYYLKAVLKKILKENQGLDIDELEEQKTEITDRLKLAYLDLADLGESKDPKLIGAKREKVNQVRDELIEIDSDIINYLSPCIENQVEKKYVEYLTFLCAEKQVDIANDKWERIWDDFNTFEMDNTHLAIKAINRLTRLLLDSREIL